jgi:hypothetical protein
VPSGIDRDLLFTKASWFTQAVWYNEGNSQSEENAYEASQMVKDPPADPLYWTDCHCCLDVLGKHRFGDQ